MKIEVVKLMTGDRQLEVISETADEYRLLDKAWKLYGYERGYGKSACPSPKKGMVSGFYIPLGQTATRKNKYNDP